MAQERLTLRVLTPTKIVTDKPVEYVVLATEEGDMGVLPGHARLAVHMGEGMLRIYQGKKVVEKIFILGGIASIDAGSVTVLSPVAGDAEDVKQALLLMEKAVEERKSEEVRSTLDVQRAEAALRNALVSLDVSVFSVISSVPLEAGLATEPEEDAGDIEEDHEG